MLLDVRDIHGRPALEEIEGVYLAALDAPDRAAFLRQACGNDTSLHEAVDLLLTQEPSTVSLIGRLALVGLAVAPTL